MTTENIRLFATVRARVLHPNTRHTLGLPQELAENENKSEQLPPPDVVVIKQESEGNFFLYRMTRSGEPAGDTWHQSIDDAKHQAEYEYGEVLGEWRAIPVAVTDPIEFAVEAVRKQMDSQS